MAFFSSLLHSKVVARCSSIVAVSSSYTENNINLTNSARVIRRIFKEGYPFPTFKDKAAMELN